MRRWGDVHPQTLAGPGALRVVQSFGDSMAWTGGTDDRDVTVNGAQGTVSHDELTGELVLVWRLGSDGMALVASESDFSAAELIRFAEAVRAP